MMRSKLLLALLLLIQSTFHAQTAEEILSDLKITYSGVANYVDKGTYTWYIQREGKLEREVSSTSFYHVAMDTSQNVFHWIFECTDNPTDCAIATPRTQGYEYKKTSDQEEGTFIRLAENRKVPETRTLSMACASLYAVGGGILDMTAGLMFPYLYDTNAYVAPMFRYDSLIRISDTLLNEQKCYVLERFHSHFETQEMIDDFERRRDSIQSRHPMPPGAVNQHREPGLRKFKNRYCVRISDGMIVRMDRLHFKNEEYYIVDAIEMDPKVNVSDFEKYLNY